MREHRRWLTTFVIVGGGFSGVETAGELVDFLHASLRYYRNIDREDIRIVLLHAGDRLMPELSAPLGAFTLRKMMKHDVDVRLNARAVRVTDRAVILDNGDIIEGGTVVCTIGTQPNPLLGDIPAPKERGRLTVNDDFSVPGVDGLWAAGDCAAVRNAQDGKSAPPTAQFAEAAANRLAGNILAKLAGQPTVPFSYSPKGQMASIGHNKAVAEIFGIRLSGFIAWLMWRGLYLLRVPTFAREVAPVPGVELGDVLSAGYLASGVPQNAAKDRDSGSQRNARGESRLAACPLMQKRCQSGAIRPSC